MGIVFNYLSVVVAAVAWCVIIVLSVILLVYLIRISKWYIKKNDIPPLFSRSNKKEGKE